MHSSYQIQLDETIIKVNVKLKSESTFHFISIFFFFSSSSLGEFAFCVRKFEYYSVIIEFHGVKILANLEGKHTFNCFIYSYLFNCWKNLG